MQRRWIHEDPAWPDLTFDESVLATPLAAWRHRQGRFLGRMESLGFEWAREASLLVLTDDVVHSSAIEGEHLNRAEVRSSIARGLGMDQAGLIPSGRDVDGVVEMMLDATRNFSEPLTAERLFGWHAALFPTGRSGMHRIRVGDWRGGDCGPMQVVSGPAGRETLHFEAPDASRLEKEMGSFLCWLEEESALDPVLKAGIAHFRFVTLHPFADGNGRIARAIGDLMLARSEGLPDRFYSLSSQIEAERQKYYRILEQEQRGTPEITPWLEWFLHCLDRALDRAEVRLEQVLLRSRFWRRIHHQPPLHERQIRILRRMLDDDFQGFMSTSKYARMAKCSPDTALRDIQDLVTRGLFLKNPGGGRSTSYRLALKEAGQ